MAIPLQFHQEARRSPQLAGSEIASKEPLQLSTVYLLGIMAIGYWSLWQPHY